MSEFEAILIEEVSISKCVYKLKTNGKIPFDEFFDDISKDKNFENEAGQIQSILELIGRDEENKIPRAKFKQLKRDKKDKIPDFEIKTKGLRVYLFRDDKLGKLVVLGGKKKSQKQDINKLRKLKKDYFNSKNE